MSTTMSTVNSETPNFVIHKKSRMPCTTSYNGPTFREAGIQHRYKELYTYKEAVEVAEILSGYNPVGFEVSPRP